MLTVKLRDLCEPHHKKSRMLRHPFCQTFSVSSKAGREVGKARAAGMVAVVKMASLTIPTILSFLTDVYEIWIARSF